MFIELHTEEDGRPGLINVNCINRVFPDDDDNHCIVVLTDSVRYTEGKCYVNYFVVEESYSQVMALLASADKIFCSGSNKGMDEPDVPGYDEWSDELKQTFKDFLPKTNLPEN